MSRYDIADYLAISIETVSRALTDLRRRGPSALQPRAAFKSFTDHFEAIGDRAGFQPGRCPVPLANQIRTYRWCNPPRIGNADMGDGGKRRGVLRAGADDLHGGEGQYFIRDTAPVASIASTPLVVEVTPVVPAKTVPEFIAYAKANPGKINMAASTIGSPVHVAGELFKMMPGRRRDPRSLSWR